MAINLSGLNIIPQGATLTTGGAAPLGLNNEIRGGIHRISGESGDTLTDISGNLLQAGMLVYNETNATYFQYIHVGDAPDNPTDPNDPYRDEFGNLPNTNDNWQVATVGGGGNSIPFYSDEAVYNFGDMIAYRFEANAIAPGVPAAASTVLFTYVGAVSGDQSTAEEPFIASNTGPNRSSRDWARPAGIISFFNTGASYAAGSLAEYQEQLWRARRDVIRPLGANQPNPVEGDDWELISPDRSAALIGRNAADTADIPILDTNISRQEWDLFNRQAIGLSLSPDDDIGVPGTTASPVLLNGVTGAQIRTLIGASSQTANNVWSSALSYNQGDVVTFTVPSGSIFTSTATTPPTTVPSVATVVQFRAIVGDTTIGEAPVVPPVGNGYGSASNEWEVLPGTIAPWWSGATSTDGILQYGAGSYATYNNSLFRAEQNVRQGGNGRVSAPDSTSVLWELDSPAGEPAAITKTGEGASALAFSNTNFLSVGALLQNSTYLTSVNNVPAIQFNDGGSSSIGVPATIPQLRTAWGNLTSTLPVNWRTGNQTYLGQNVNVPWPMINGNRIALEGSVGVGAFQFQEITDRFQPGALTYQYPEPLDPGRTRQTQVPTGGSSFFRYLARPPEIADATTYWLQIDDASTLAPEGLNVGTYLVTSRFNTVSGTDVVEFDNIRPIDINNGIPGNQFIFPTNAATTTDSFDFTLFARDIAQGAAWVNTDLANEVVFDVYELNNTNSQVDFAKVPTVNNVPLATEADVLTDEQRRVIDASNSTSNQAVIANTQYGGGFEVRTESNSRVGTQRSQLGDVTLSDPFSLGQTNEWLIALSGGTQVLINFDSTSGVDFSNVQAGDSLILRLANGNVARQGVAEANAIPAGDYLVFALLAGSEFALTIDARSIRRINGDTSLQNHLGAVTLLENHSIPFPENSITIFEGSYSSEWELSTTDNEGYFRVDNRGTHTNRRHYLSGTTLSSEGRVTGTGTPLPEGSIDTFVGVFAGGVLSFTVLNGVDTSAIAVGDPVQFSTTVAGNNNVFPAGTHIGYRVAGGDTSLNLDATRIYPVVNGFIQPPLQVTSSWNYPVGTEITVTGGLTVEPEFQIDLTDGTIYEMDEEGIFITPPGGTREGFSKISSSVPPVSGDIATWRTPDTIQGRSFEELLSGEFVLVESNIPTDPARLVANQEYAFRVSTRDRQIPAGGPRVTADSFRLSLRTGSIVSALDIPATGYNANNSDTITSNTTRLYRVSWSADDVQRLKDATPATGEVLQARLFIDTNVAGDPPIFDLVATHNPDLDTSQIVRSGTANVGQIPVWTSIDGDVRGLRAENFQTLLALDGLYIESDIPFDATDLQSDFLYSFRISTGNYPTNPTPTLRAEDFIITTAQGQLPATLLDFERVTDNITSTAGQTVYFGTRPTNQRAALPDFDTLTFTLGGVVRNRGTAPGEYQAAIVPNPDTTVGGNVWRVTLSASQATAGLPAILEYDTTTQDSIASNTSRVYRASWNAASVTTIQESAERFPDDVLRVLVNLPNIGPFIATHNSAAGGDSFAPTNSPTFTGTPRAPTPSFPDDDSTQIATTEFVHNSVDLLPVLKMPSNGSDLDLNQLSYDVTFWRPHLSTSHTTTLRFSDIDVSGVNPTSVLDDDGTPVEVDANGRFTIQNLNANYRLVFTQNAIAILRSASNQLRFAVRFNNGQAGDRSIFGVLTGDGGGEFNPQVSQNHHDILVNRGNITSNTSRIRAIENQISSGTAGATLNIPSYFFSIDNIPNQDSAGNDDEVLSYWNLGEDPNTDASRPFSLNTTVTARTDSFTSGSTELPAFIRNRLNTELQNRLERLDAYFRTNPGSAADSTVTGVFGQQFVMAAAFRLSGSGSWITLNVSNAQAARAVNHTMSTPAPYDFTTDEYTTIECRWFLSRAGSGNTLDYGPTVSTTNTVLAPVDPTAITALTTAINDNSRTVFIHWEDSAGRRLIEPVTGISNPTVNVPAELSNLQYHGITVSRTTASVLRPTFGSAIRFSEGNGGGTTTHLFDVDIDGIVPGPSLQEREAGNEFLNANGDWTPALIQPGPLAPLGLPLTYRKTDLFLGAEGESGTTSLSVGAGTMNVSWTYYTTDEVNYYFLDGVELVGAVLEVGDGLWTIADPRVDTITAGNSANLIG